MLKHKVCTQRYIESEVEMTTVVEFFFSLYNKRMYKKYIFILNEQFDLLLLNTHLENA